MDKEVCTETTEKSEALMGWDVSIMFLYKYPVCLISAIIQLNCFEKAGMLGQKASLTTAQKSVEIHYVIF